MPRRRPRRLHLAQYLAGHDTRSLPARAAGMAGSRYADLWHLPLVARRNWLWSWRISFEIRDSGYTHNRRFHSWTAEK
jgi:hypothetical protein